MWFQSWLLTGLRRLRFEQLWIFHAHWTCLTHSKTTHPTFASESGAHLSGVSWNGSSRSSERCDSHGSCRPERMQTGPSGATRVVSDGSYPHRAVPAGIVNRYRLGDSCRNSAAGKAISNAAVLAPLVPAFYESVDQVKCLLVIFSCLFARLRRPFIRRGSPLGAANGPDG